MRLIIAAVGERMPTWVNDAMAEYMKRMPKHLKIEVLEIAMSNRVKQPDIQKAMQDEAQRLLSNTPSNAHHVVLDGGGQNWSSVQLSLHLQRWQTLGKPVCLSIGGPDGHAKSLLDVADQTWSLGALTLPHPLVRIIIAEQLYRAASMLANHPYHRA